MSSQNRCAREKNPELSWKVVEWIAPLGKFSLCLGDLIQAQDCKWYLFPNGSVDKESACNAGDPGLIPEVRKIPWRRKWQPAPVFLLAKSQWTEEPGSRGVTKSPTRVGHEATTKEDNSVGCLNSQHPPRIPDLYISIWNYLAGIT